MIESAIPYVLVGVGGCAGAIARFAVARWVAVWMDTPFPLGTFVINVSGSFLLGILGTLVAERVWPDGDALRLALGVGFLGAYTTFSTFEFETHALLEDGSWLLASINVAGSVLLGLLAVRAGILLTKGWLG
jgi:CrcB protein